MHACMHAWMDGWMDGCMYGMVWYGMVWYGMVWYGMYVCMYVCICVYICIYIYLYIYIYTCMYVYIYICMYICIYICIYVYIYMYIYISPIYPHEYLNKSMWLIVYIYIHIYIYIYIYIHTYIYTYICIYIYIHIYIYIGNLGTNGPSKLIKVDLFQRWAIQSLDWFEFNWSFFSHPILGLTNSQSQTGTTDLGSLNMCVVVIAAIIPQSSPTNPGHQRPGRSRWLWALSCGHPESQQLFHLRPTRADRICADVSPIWLLWSTTVHNHDQWKAILFA